MALRPSLDFLKNETAAGATVALAGLIGFALANSPWSQRYFGLIGADFTVQIGAFSETLTRQAWIRQGLMAVFFFLVGMELKQEVLRGELSSPRRLALPALAAIGGFVAPALVYLAVSAALGGSAHGWAVSVAGDTVLPLAVLATVGRALPQSLRVFLMAALAAGQLAVILVIGLVYAGDIHMWSLAGAALSLMGLVALAEWKDAPFLFRATGYLLLWGFTLKSGLQAPVAGAVAALTVPGTGRRPGHEAVLRHYLRTLKPYVDFAVLPLFALTAAGVSLKGFAPGQVFSSAAAGVVVALAVGKPAGVLAAAFLAVRSGLARRPTGATWLELWGLACLTGAAFATGLFMANLAFPPGDAATPGVVLAAVLGSLVSAGSGWCLLSLAAAQRRLRRPDLGAVG